MSQSPYAPQQTFYPALDAFRGLAALSVVFFHLKFVNGTAWVFFENADILVDFFFLLSGFVMTHAYAPRISMGLSFQSFVRGRIARLYPLHIALLLVWVPYILMKVYIYQKTGLGTDPKQTENIWSFVMNLFLLQSMHTVDGLSWNYPAWSISAEFWTYITFFFVIRLARQNTLYVMVVLIVCSALFFGLMDDTETSGRGILVTYDYGFIRCVMSFFLGALVYRMHKKFVFIQHYSLCSAIECILILLSIFMVMQSGNGMPWHFGALITFSITLFWFSGSKGLMTSFLSVPVFKFLGTISYSVYMTHAIVVAVADNVARYVFKMPLIELKNGHRPAIDTIWADPINIIIVLFVILISSFTYRYIEVPGMRLGRSRLPS